MATNMDEVTQLTGILQQIVSLQDRFVLSFEKIASSLALIGETYQKQTAKQYPDRSGEIREAVVSRVPTQEDLVREAQGASNEPIGEWLSEVAEEEEEDIGTREREWLEREDRDAGAKGNRPRKA
jgi:hypothetical protein